MFRYLALGDSYTIGEGVKTRNSWPGQLKSLLEKKLKQISDVSIIARTGWTTAELLEAIMQQKVEPIYDLVTLQVGVNDQYRGYPLKIFENEYVKLIEKAIFFAQGRSHQVLTISIPDWSVTPFAAGRDRKQISNEIDVFNQSARSIALTRGLNWIDVTGLSRSLGGGKDMLVQDGLHPSLLQYKLWVDQISPYVFEIGRSEK